MNSASNMMNSVFKNGELRAELEAALAGAVASVPALMKSGHQAEAMAALVRLHSISLFSQSFLNSLPLKTVKLQEEAEALKLQIKSLGSPEATAAAAPAMPPPSPVRLL